MSRRRRCYSCYCCWSCACFFVFILSFVFAKFIFAVSEEEAESGRDAERAVVLVEEN